MKADRIIAAEQLVTLTGYVASELIGQPDGGRSLPSPKIVVGVLAFYGGLAWVASLGRQAARVASAVGGLVMLVFLMRPLVLGALQRVSGGLIGFLSSGNAASVSAQPSSSGA